MTDVMAHRGPDDAGSWIDQEYGVGLAHRRLSIVDLSAAGQQPMLSSDQRFVISFNGEIYNFSELSQQLTGLGHEFRTRTDTEVLLKAVQQWGIHGALERVIGMFAFAIWDRQSQTLQISRDRMGKKPVYYAFHAGSWAFASELKSLRQIDWLSWSLDSTALSLYMRYGYVPAPATMYAQVFKLPAGTILTLGINGQAPQLQRYWSVNDVALEALSEQSQNNVEDMLNALDGLIADAVSLRMVADVEVGSFLSGGIDSSLVTAYMQQQSTRPIKTFTVGFKEKQFNEAQFAREISTYLGTEHQELMVDARDLLADVDGLTSVMDEPFADISLLPTLLLSRMTARHVKVALSGDGGDELFCGYRHYDRVVAAQKLVQGLPVSVRKPMGRLLRNNNAGAGKIARLGAVLQSDNQQELCTSVLSTWQSPALLVARGTNEDVFGDDWSAAGNVTDIRNYMMLRDMRRYLVDDILHKVDRASMAASLEVRAPLLDHRIVEFAWQVPVQLKQRNGVAKWPLKQLLARKIPAALFERPKQGFAVPISHWLRTDLNVWANELLHNGAGLQFLDKNVLHSIWRQHNSGRWDRGSYLWIVLAFLAWFERNGVDSV